jgi:hypothetical protein
MMEPQPIETHIALDEAGSEVATRVGGCKHDAFCHRRNIEGDILETCPHLSYLRDWVAPGGIQEYCTKGV